MPSTLEEAFLQKTPKKKLVIGVAIDGSNISDKALATACGFYNAARGDRLVILHVSDSSKTFLPRHLQPKHLESQYVDKAHSLKVRVQLQSCLMQQTNAMKPTLQSSMTRQYCMSELD